jgi:hypothetical protein
MTSGGEHDRVEMVLGAGGLEPADLADRGHAVAGVRADDERRVAVTVEAHLQRPVEEEVLLGEPARRPVVEVGVHAGRLDPRHAGIVEVSERALEVLATRPVIDVELDEDVVLDARRRGVVQPRVDVPGLRLRLERREGLVVARQPVAREIPHSEGAGELLDLGVGTLVEHP